MTPGNLEGIPELLSELDGADSEHADVSVHHESGLSLAVFPSGHVVLENLESGDPPKSAALSLESEALRQLIKAVAEGNLSGVNGIGWREGYGWPE